MVRTCPGSPDCGSTAMDASAGSGGSSECGEIVKVGVIETLPTATISSWSPLGSENINMSVVNSPDASVEGFEVLPPGLRGKLAQYEKCPVIAQKTARVGRRPKNIGRAVVGPVLR